MDTQSEIIRHSELLNRLVLDRNTTETLGNLEHLWLDPHANQIMGITCKSGLLGRNKQKFAWSQIETIGKDSILVNPSPEEMTTETPENTNLLIGNELWTDAGNKIGQLVDYLFNFKTGAIVKYLFVSNGWRGVLDGVYILEPIAISSVGSKRIIVLDAAVKNAQQYSEGLGQKIEQAKDFIKEDYQKTKKELEAAVGQKKTADQLRETIQSVTSQAKDKFTEAKTKLQNTAKEKTETKE